MKERKEKKGEEKGKEIVKGRKKGRGKVNHQPGGPTKRKGNEEAFEMGNKLMNGI